MRYLANIGRGSWGRGGGEKNYFKILVEKPQANRLLGNPEVLWRIILKCVLKELRELLNGRESVQDKVQRRNCSA